MQSDKNETHERFLVFILAEERKKKMNKIMSKKLENVDLKIERETLLDKRTHTSKCLEK